MAIEHFKTRFGTVHHSTTCKDDFDNIVTRVRKRGKPGNRTDVPFTLLTLQKPAIDSIRAVERAMGKPWAPFYVRATGTIRTCEQQMALWLSDKERFAHPNSTLHTQGLAIDIHTSFLSDRLRKEMLAHGWHQSRPVDEPWHFSFRLTA